ncbi:MAG: AMP-binding protein [Candidatus Rokubacteria bacterium]|nr:AMP-binding protein [Candidatus Rokubacteria bacterium]
MSRAAPNMTDYAATMQEFRLTVPERFNWAFDTFDHWARDPTKLALLWVSADGQPRYFSYAEVGERSRRVANALGGLGVWPGDRVFVMLPRVYQWWEIVLGCLRARAVSVPGTTLLTAKDIVYRLNACEAAVVITDEENRWKVDQARRECPTVRHCVVVGRAGGGWLGYEDLLSLAPARMRHPENASGDPMMLYFTSGTTGHPKMVLHTHASYPIGHLVTGRFWLDHGPDDLHWTLSDTGWAQAAWTCLFAPWNMGAAVFVWDARGKRFEPGDTLAMLERFPISTFFAPPTAYRMLVQEPLRKHRFRALRHCMGAGEAVNPEVIEAWREGTGHHIHEGYGQTETVLLAATFPATPWKPGSMGPAAPGHVLAIVDDEGRELPRGTEGDLAVQVRPERPVGMFTGYWKNEEATARCHRGDWYVTGDRASMDEDGYLWFVGRADDVITSASYRIGPFEVESALVEHAAVAEAAVIGKADPLRGEIVKAFVVLAAGRRPSPALVTELQEHVKRVTAPYKYPREIEFVPDLPKTISGKIRRTELRQMERDRASRRP